MTVTGRVFGTLPASDLARAKDFYAHNLGLKPAKETDEGLLYECADNTRIFLFPSTGRASGNHTQAMFEVENVEAEVAEMKAHGVVFEEYDKPDFKTENGVLTMPDGGQAAWFKDSEGNLLCIGHGIEM